jgi:hypothetical protein
VPVEFGDGDRLDDVEPVPRAVIEELLRLLAVQAVEEFPRGCFVLPVLCILPTSVDAVDADAGWARRRMPSPG